MTSDGAVINISRPSEIRPEHLRKLAIIYVRQSSEEQVEKNTGSTEDQRSLVTLPRGWGWREEDIVVMDHDLGVSANSSGLRNGFEMMLEKIERDEVGIVVFRDHKRLSRNPLDAERFLLAAQTASILVEIGGRIFDAANPTLLGLLEFRLQGLMAWWDNAERTKIFRAAALAKARTGHAVTRPPIGYVQSSKGQWSKDHDPEVRQAVDRAFRLYQELGSLNKVRLAHRKEGFLFPHRRHGQIVWAPITRSSLAALLTNPNYTGDYVYQRYKVITKAGRRKNVKRASGDWEVFPNHHEPYISRPDFDALQESLTANNPRVRPPRGKGNALLQGLLRCVCGKWMRTNYQRTTRGWSASYYCVRQRDDVRLHSAWVSAKMLDAAVLEHVFRAITPIGIAEALNSIEEQRNNEKALQRSHARIIQTAEDEAEALQRKYLSVDAANHLVKNRLEAQLEEALRALDDLRRRRARLDAVPSSKALNVADADSLISLTDDVRTLWDAPTTSNEDRKRLLQTVVSTVVLHDDTADFIDFEIVWVGGFRETHRAFRPRRLVAYVNELRAQGKRRQDIAETLLDKGLLALYGRSDTPSAIKQKLRSLDLDGHTEWIASLEMIRELTVAGKQRAEILDALNAPDGPNSGKWDFPRVARVVARLRRGPVRGVAQLPDTVPAEEARKRALDLAIERHRNGATWSAIANELNGLGIRPEMAKEFSAGHIYHLVRSHLDRGGVARKRGPRPRAQAPAQ